MTNAPFPITPRPPRKTRSPHAQRLAHVAIAAQDAGLGSLALSLQNICVLIDNLGIDDPAVGDVIKERARFCRATAKALGFIADDLDAMLEASDG